MSSPNITVLPTGGISPFFVFLTRNILPVEILTKKVSGGWVTALAIVPSAKKEGDLIDIFPRYNTDKQSIDINKKAAPIPLPGVLFRSMSINPKAKIYLADYAYKIFIDINKKSISLDYFRNRKMGVLTAIGYPRGFIDILYGLGIDIGRKIIYSDHYNLDAEEIKRVENSFRKEGINDIIITYKDFYHLDFKKAALNYFIMEADLKIEDEENFLREVDKFITQTITD